MNDFAQLILDLDETQSVLEKTDRLTRYLQQAQPGDAAWAVWLLAGNKLKRHIPLKHLQEWCGEISGIPEWLFQESYQFVGDLAETIALLLGRRSGTQAVSLQEMMEQQLSGLASLEPEEKKERINSLWQNLNPEAVFVFNKLLTGGFRAGVSRGIVCRALAGLAGVPEAVMMHRLSGNWQPGLEAYQALLSGETTDDGISRPYPFFLATSWEENKSPGAVESWLAEWKWDGIRAQLIFREGQTFIWSRGEELMQGRFPEVEQALKELPDGTVLDGELLAWKGTGPLPFSELQKRIGRKAPGKKVLQEIPVVFMAYDILEHHGQDIRDIPLTERRQRLEQLTGGAEGIIRLSPVLSADTWEGLAEIRANASHSGAEGLMLKQKDSVYQAGRKRGAWWKWKTEPCSLDAVLVYAQRGHGRRAGLFTDYTFALWDDGVLKPFAKAYSGLTDSEIREVDAYIKANTLEKFGPVRTVAPELVFEIAFEGVRLSPRHKIGLAVRFPRMVRWRKDKKPGEADTLAALSALLPSGQSSDLKS